MVFIFSELLKFLAELESLKRKKREGVRTEGVENPDSVAEHSFLVAHIARLIAHEENLDVAKAVEMALCHDLGEARLGDRDKLAEKYLGKCLEAEREALKDQTEPIPEKLAKRTVKLFEEKEDRSSDVAKVVQDSDWLEMAFQAKIYMEKGHNGDFEKWLDSIEDSLHTETAKELMKKLREMEGFTNSYINR